MQKTAICARLSRNSVLQIRRKSVSVLGGRGGAYRPFSCLGLKRLPSLGPTVPEYLVHIPFCQLPQPPLLPLSLAHILSVRQVPLHSLLPDRARGHLELDVARRIDELDDRVRRVVALAPPELVDPRVAAFSCRVAVGEQAEEFLEELRLE